MAVPVPRFASLEDAQVVAQLLHDFNTEFGSPSPGVKVLTQRLRGLLAGGSTTAILAGDPAVAVALLTARSNVWYPGPVLLLDELYVVPELRDRGIGSAVMGRLLAHADELGAGLVEINVDEGDLDTQRFYVHHGFTTTEPGSPERAFYYWRELIPVVPPADAGNTPPAPSAPPSPPRAPTS